MTWYFYTSPQPNGCPIVGDHKGQMICVLAHSINEPSQSAQAMDYANQIAAVPEMLEFIKAKAEEGDSDAHKLLLSIDNGDRHKRVTRGRLRR